MKSTSIHLFNDNIQPTKLFDEMNDIDDTMNSTNSTTTTTSINSCINNQFNNVVNEQQNGSKSRSRRQSSSSENYKIHKNHKLNLKVYKGKKAKQQTSTTLCLENMTNIKIENNISLTHLPAAAKITNEQESEQINNIKNESVSDQRSTPTPTTTKVSREVIQLQKMVKESKILTEFMNDSSSETKLRQKKIIKPINTTNHSCENIKVNLNAPKRSRSFCLDMIFRRNARARLQSECKSTKKIRRSQSETIIKRFSQSPDCRSTKTNSQNESIVNDGNELIDMKIKLKKIHQQEPVFNSLSRLSWDQFCFNCHQDKCSLACTTCKRSYHKDCLRSKLELKTVDDPIWKCPECITIRDAELVRKRKSKPEIEQLRTMLLFALKRLSRIVGAKQTSGPSTAVTTAVPMSFNILEANICSKQYRTTEAFLADIKWIQHNCHTAVQRSSKLIAASKELVKACKQEMHEIDTCVECYYNANVHRDDWFVRVCKKPHILLWAKLKGFPYWPAKMMGINASSMVDVRFFGQHDRAWLPTRDCYLFSRNDPNVTASKSKRISILSCLKEVDVYIENIRKIYGGFEYAPFKYTYDPIMNDQYLQLMIPQYSSNIVNTTSNTSDLTYKIIKSSNNHLSFVKKTNNPHETFISEDALAFNKNATKPKHHIVDKHKSNNSSSPTIDKQHQRKSSSQKCMQSNEIYEILPTSSGNATKVVLKRKLSHSELNFCKKIRKSHDESMQNNSINDDNDVATASIRNTRAASLTNAATKMNSIEQNDFPFIQRSSKRVKEQQKQRLSASIVNMDDNQCVSSTVLPNHVAEINCITNNSDKHVIASNNLISSEIVDSTISVIDSTMVSSDIDASTTQLDIDHHTDDNASGSDIPSSTTINQLPAPQPQPPPPPLEKENILLPITSIKTEINYDEYSSTITNPATEQNCIDKEVKKENIFTDDTALDVQIKVEPESKEMPTINTNSELLNLEKIPPLIPRSNYGIELNETANSTNKQRNRIMNSKQNRFPLTINQTNNSIGNPLNGMVYIPLDNTQLQHINATTCRKTYNLYNTDAFSSFKCNPKMLLPPPLIARNHTKSISTSTITSHQATLSTSITQINVPTTTSTINVLPNLQQHPLPIQLNTFTETTNTDLQPIVTSKPITNTINNNSSCSNAIINTETKSQLVQNYVKIVGHLFTTMLEEKLNQITDSKQLDELKIRLLQFEIEQEKFNFDKTLTELQRNADKKITELKQKLENDKKKILNDLNTEMMVDNQRQYDYVKTKQWCCNCGIEASYSCCFNTSYCSIVCQHQHWTQHMSMCTNFTTANGNEQQFSTATTTTTMVLPRTSLTATTTAPTKTDQHQLFLQRGMLSQPLSNENHSQIVLTESELNDLVANRIGKPSGSNMSFLNHPMLVPFSTNQTTLLPIVGQTTNLLPTTGGGQFASRHAVSTYDMVPPLVSRLSTPTVRKPRAVSTRTKKKQSQRIQLPNLVSPNLVSLSNGTHVTLPKACTVKIIQRNVIDTKKTPLSSSSSTSSAFYGAPMVSKLASSQIKPNKPLTTRTKSQITKNIQMNHQIQQPTSFTIFNQQGGHLILTPIQSSSSSSSMPSSMVNTIHQPVPPLINMHAPLQKNQMNGVRNKTISSVGQIL